MHLAPAAVPARDVVGEDELVVPPAVAQHAAGGPLLDQVGLIAGVLVLDALPHPFAAQPLHEAGKAAGEDAV